MWLGASQSWARVTHWYIGIFYTTLLYSFLFCVWNICMREFCARREYSYVILRGLSLSITAGISRICLISPRVPIWTSKMLSIHPFRFMRAHWKGHELDIDFMILTPFCQSRSVVRFDLLWNVHFLSQNAIWPRFYRQTRVPGKPPQPLWYHL